jgi:hypothetical protein
VALTELIDRASTIPIRLPVLPYFLAYLLTLVPFYHGALRHLDITYVQEASQRPRAGALMGDWSLLFIESCLLVAIALLVGRPAAFSYVLAFLLAFDTVWAFVAHLAFSAPGQRAERKWAMINLVSAALLVLSIVYLDTLDAAQKPVATYRWVVLLTICGMRTIIDYWWCWSYYYPGSQNEQAA